MNSFQKHQRIRVNAPFCLIKALLEAATGTPENKSANRREQDSTIQTPPCSFCRVGPYTSKQAIPIAAVSVANRPTFTVGPSDLASRGGPGVTDVRLAEAMLMLLFQTEGAVLIAEVLAVSTLTIREATFKGDVVVGDNAAMSWLRMLATIDIAVLSAAASGAVFDMS